MRIVKSDSGQQFNIRGLTRREVKNLLADDNINLMDIHAGNAEQALDKVLKLVLSEHEVLELDDMPYRLSMNIWSAVLAETYGSRDEEKN